MAGRNRVKNLHIITSKGKRYFYHRKTRARIKGEPGTAEFYHQIAIEDAKVLNQKPIKNSLGALIEAYRKSPEYRSLAPRTKSDYDKIMHWMQTGKRKDTPLNGLKPSTITKIRDIAFKMHKRTFANYVVTCFSLLFNWGMQHDFIETNPAAKVKKLRKPTNEGPANRPWTQAERLAALDAAPQQLILPMALALYAGLRQGDVIKLPWTAYDGGSINFIQSKTGDPIWVPTGQVLKTIIDNTKRHSPIMCLTTKHTPWTASGFRASFFKLIRELEQANKVQPGLTFHGLRTTLATDIAEAGGSEKEMMAVLGHRTEAMASHYSRQANKKKLAKGAIERAELKNKK
ncbi:tyrosine-type recombinase/integrase [Cohaesibacter intestini]|uniref:tyrosine-type recombinase/integrase n=1 Tax=Cohaesibacter intestini TaxID=2211145 RepID=UPI000DEAABDC|nr:tyrosine-type recombinase/integrase [Cohaesibacter intestini]